MDLDEMFDTTLGLMGTEEGQVKVPMDPTGNVDPKWLMQFMISLKSDLLMLKAQMFVIWSTNRESYSQLGEDEQKVLLDHFNAELKKLGDAYKNHREEAAKPKVLQPKQGGIITP
jgi:hypothetical protein